ncbi:hypothetical protein [Vibrio breoganii]|uniref:Uncharacterized protein n=3 Tax=Vibrio breoganii TaxID=553239 RepID=A0ABX1U833_9VIBR|nr:hypothetical protein [Vibrio breoganii]NMO75090.1 hypothetical protein [Vibrio breoganii]NMR69411.1 hypothetical protein [Vibrio breoganii]
MASQYLSGCEIQTLALSKILNRVQDDVRAVFSHHYVFKRTRYAGSHVMASQYISGCEIQTLALSKILNRVQDDACAVLFASLLLKTYSSCWKPCNDYPVS